MVKVFFLAFFSVSFFAWPAFAEQRRDKPCSELSEKERRVTERCKTDQERREDEQKKRLAEIEEAERPARSSFLKWLHVDGGWVQSSNSTVFQGLIGTHICVFETGRLQIYGPPGIMLIRQRTGPSEHRLQAAFTWGFSIRLFDARFPGTSRNIRVFGNVAKVWSGGSRDASSLSARSGIDMIGLSVTFGK